MNKLKCIKCENLYSQLLIQCSKRFSSCSLYNKPQLAKSLDTFTKKNNGKFENSSISFNPGFMQVRKKGFFPTIHNFGIVWNKQELVEVWDPKKTGDLQPFEEIDKSKPRINLKCIEEEIMKSDKVTQDLLSIGFGHPNEVLIKAMYNTRRKVQRHQYDDTSLEVRIADATVFIRYWQKKVMADQYGISKYHKIKLKERIEKRAKYLRQMQRLDYKCFEWLLEVLDIRMFPDVRDRKPTRKTSITKLVEMYCANIKKREIENYKKELESLKEPFLKEKAETLKWIAETERKLGLPISVELPEDASNESKVPLLESNANDGPSSS